MDKPNNTYEFDIDALLNLFDKKKDKNSTSGINAILGEELGAGIFLDYLKCSNREGRIIGGEPIESNDSERLKTVPEKDKKYKKKLDRWIITNENIYQVEIKNWNTNSLNVYQKNVDDSNLYQACEQNFKKHFNLDKENCRVLSLKHNSTAKVLLKMDSSSIQEDEVITKIEKVENCQTETIPLLIFWFPVCPFLNDNYQFTYENVEPKEDSNDPHYMFEIKFDKENTHGKDNLIVDRNKLTVFSMSLYLRFLKGKGDLKIKLELPWFNETIEILKRIGAIKEPEKRQ